MLLSFNELGTNFPEKMCQKKVISITPFFAVKDLLAALLTIFLLWGMIATLIKLFYRIEKKAAYLLLPYLAWVSFATLLNAALLLLN